MRFQHDFTRADRRVRRNRPAVEFLADEPASGSKRRRQPSQNLSALRQMDQHHAGVYQIVRALRQRIASDVVAKDIQMWRSQSLEESRIDIRDEDTAGGADALAEPRRNRSASAPDFQAPPTCREAAIQQMALCRTIEDRRQRGEPRRRGRPVR